MAFKLWNFNKRKLTIKNTYSSYNIGQYSKIKSMVALDNVGMNTQLRINVGGKADSNTGIPFEFNKPFYGVKKF